MLTQVHQFSVFLYIPIVLNIRYGMLFKSNRQSCSPTGDLGYYKKEVSFTNQYQ